MPLGDIVESALRPLTEIVFEGVLYWTGRLVVPLLSVGLARVERLSDESLSYSLFGLARDARGRIVLSANAGSFSGLFVLVGAVFFVAYVVRSA